MQLPFRLQLRGALDLETTSLLFDILQSHARAIVVPNLDQVIDTANELVLWELARQLFDHPKNPGDVGVFSRFQKDWSRQAARLIKRAIRDADAEGIVWSPVLDALACTGIWADLQEDSDDVAWESIPTPNGRASRLASWVSETTDRAALKDLLRFRAEAVHLVVAEHARAFDPDLVSRLLLTPSVVKRILKTRTVDNRLGAVLVERAYGRWRRLVLENDGFVDELTNLEPEALRIMLRHGLSLSPSLRKDALNLVHHKKLAGTASEIAAEFLVLDKSTPADVLLQIERHVNLGVRYNLIAHPNCPDQLWDKLTADRFDLESALNTCQLPPERVLLVHQRARTRYYYHALLPGLCRQRYSTPEIWCDGLQKGTSVGAYEALAKNPRARRHPKVRAALFEADSEEVILRLLKDQKPEEFESLVLRFLKINRQRALRFLEKGGVPPGTPFPQKLIRKLLASKDKRGRLVGITLVSKFDELAPAILPRMRSTRSCKRRSHR